MKCSNCGSTLAPGEMFCGECGTRRPALPQQFQAVQKRFYELKRLLQSGEMDEAAYEKALQDLVIEDERGQYWMIGADSEEWYRYDGEEWQREDPPAPKESAKKAPRPAEREETPVVSRSAKEAPPPAKPGGRKGRWLLPLGGCLMVFVLLCSLGVAFRQQLNNAFVNLALDQGWGTVVTEEPAAAPVEVMPYSDSAQAAEPYSTPASGIRPAPTQPGTPAPAPAVVEEPLEAGWTLTLCTPAGVQLAVPPGFKSSEYEDTAQLFITTVGGGTGLDVMCGPAENGGTFESELEWWLAFQNGVQWAPSVWGTTAIGPMAWSEGPNTKGGSIFTAVVGPTRNRHILQFWGQAPQNEWDAYVALFLKVVRSARYAP